MTMIFFYLSLALVVFLFPDEHNRKLYSATHLALKVDPNLK